MKKIVIIVILVILVIIIAIMAPPITSQTISPTVNQSSSPAPTPKPTPVVNITKDSNLSEEAKKLNVPEYESDYSSLDQTLSGF